MAYARSEQVDRTKTGLLLLITGAVIGQIGVIASVLGHIPLIGALGGIVAIIGAVLIILGRKPFGPQHSTYVWLSVGLYVLGFIITLVAATVFALEVLQNVRTGLSTPALIDAFSANFNDFLVGAFIAGAVIGIAQVLLTYALQKPAGRILLWSAYVIGLAIGIYVLSVIGAQITSAVQSAFSGGNFNRAAIDDLTTQASNLGLLSIITTIMYVVAYYLAWSRINNEEIPEPLKPPSTLTGPLP